MINIQQLRIIDNVIDMTDRVKQETRIILPASFSWHTASSFSSRLPVCSFSRTRSFTTYSRCQSWKSTTFRSANPIWPLSRVWFCSLHPFSTWWTRFGIRMLYAHYLMYNIWILENVEAYFHKLASVRQHLYLHDKQDKMKRCERIWIEMIRIADENSKLLLDYES